MLARSKSLSLTLVLAATLGCKGSYVVSVDKAQDERTGAETESTPTPTDEASPSPDPAATPTPTPASLNLTAPENFTDGDRSDSTTDSPTLTWDPVDDASSYEIAIGTSQGATDVLDWTDVGTATSLSKDSLTLPNSSMLYASVRAVGSDGSKSDAAEGDGWQNLECPSGFIKIVGNETAGLGGSVYTEGTKSNYDWDGLTETIRDISDFCVMKYEAKLEIDGTIQPDGDNPTDEIDLTTAAAEVTLNGTTVETTGSFGGGAGLVVRPVSSPTGKPWVRPERSADDDVVGADDFCESLGTGYALINNAQWQAIARDMETVSSNFDTTPGDPADHAFNRGHSDGSAALAADADDANGCANIGSDTHDSAAVAANCGGGWHLNKRTHTLSNGEVIWDLAGNAWEWVRDNNSASQGSNGYMQTAPYSDALKWGPALDYSAQTGTAKAGLGYGYLNSSAGAVIRGGLWHDGTNTGAFGAYLFDGPSTSYTFLGFRCVFAR